MVSNNRCDLATLKVLILGEGKVGKSSLLLRYVNDEFNDQHVETVGVDIKNKKINIDGDVVNVEFWDTAGQERYRSLAHLYYRNAQAAILVYDVTNKSSFDFLQVWLQQITAYSNQTGGIMMLIGNKTDRTKDRIIAKNEAERFAARNRMMYLETSAKTDDGVTVAFEEVVKKIIETPGLWKTDALQNSGAVKLTDGPIVKTPRQKNSCCSK